MYETGDLSLGKLSNTDMYGNKIFYDTNKYDEFQIHFRPEDYDYDLTKWIKRVEEVTAQPYRIRIRSKKYQVTLDGNVVAEYDNYNQAIDFLNNPVKGWKL
jgi:hypothetical protein